MINLALGDGGAEGVNPPHPDASSDDVATTKEDAKQDVNEDVSDDVSEDAKEAPITDASGDAFDEDFQKAFEAGPVLEGLAHYVQFRCCDNNGSCTTEVLGGPDTCVPDGKRVSFERCTALGSNLAAFASFGACTDASSP